jgi:hypothetical protein
VSAAKAKPATPGTIASLDLSPGDIVTVGGERFVYVGVLAGGHCGRRELAPGRYAEGFTWFADHAQAILVSSPNRDRRQVASEADRGEVDPLLVGTAKGSLL